jgi:hypothetical protein
MLAVLLLGAGASSASAKSGKVSAYLTKTSFTTAQAGSVKLVCKFSPTSRRWNYVLSLKSGGKWTKVRSLNRTGSFNGTFNTTVKKLFGSKPIKAGSYRVKVSADANSVTRTFTVKKASSSGGSGGDSSTASKPEAGHWVSTGVSGPFGRVTGVSFDVSAGQTSVSSFSFEYEYSNGACSGTARSWIDTPSPIAGGKFETPSASPWSSTGVPASGTFHGTFDSATKAHGTAQMLLRVTCGIQPPMPSDSGTFSWTAARSGS